MNMFYKMSSKEVKSEIWKFLLLKMHRAKRQEKQQEYLFMDNFQIHILTA